MRTTRLLVPGLWAATLSAALAQDVIYVPLPIADTVRRGGARVEAARLDIGTPQAALDGDPRSLARSAAVNPAFVRVEFDQPVTLHYFRVFFSSDEHAWSVGAADSAADLKSRSGSYRVLVGEARTTRSGTAGVKLPAPVTARAFQLDVTRTTGDDYVHLYEWEFCRAAAAKKLRLQYVAERAVAHKGAEIRDAPDRLSRPVQSIVWFQARAEADDGTGVDVSEAIQWEGADPGLVALGDQNGQFLIRAGGEHRLTARYGRLEETVTLVGTPRAIRNRDPDIEIFCIERLPRLDFDGPNGGWPQPGDPVTWRGHVYNWGLLDIPITYEWKLDGTVIDHGQRVIPVGPPGNDAAFVDLPWKWDPARHELTLAVTPAEPLDERIAANNTLTIHTDAITVGFWVEQSLWDFHHEHQHRLPTRDANSFAGWSQRMLRQWNQMFSAAVYPEYPRGITERVRLDRLVIVPDFALPLAGGLPSNNPDNRDRTVDLVWGHVSGDIQPGVVVKEEHWWSPERAIQALADGRVAQQKLDPPFWCGFGYIHELGHARYLIDAYGFNVHSGLGDDLAKRHILVTDEQGPILGRYMRLTDDIQHWQQYPGNMAGSEWRYSVYEAMCWNRVAGRRARGGNCNSPPNIGEFLQDIPARIIYAYADPAGQPLADADVWVYRARGTGQSWYAKVYEDPPAIRKRTDARGRVQLDRTMFSEDGRIQHGFGLSDAVALVRVTYRGQHYFLFEEVTDPNIAYNLGHRDEYVFQRQIKLRDGAPSPDEWDVNARWEAPGAGFGRRP